MYCKIRADPHPALWQWIIIIAPTAQSKPKTLELNHAPALCLFHNNLVCIYVTGFSCLFFLWWSLVGQEHQPQLADSTNTIQVHRAHHWQIPTTAFYLVAFHCNSLAMCWTNEAQRSESTNDNYSTVPTATGCKVQQSSVRTQTQIRRLVSFFFFFLLLLLSIALFSFCRNANKLSCNICL